MECEHGHGPMVWVECAPGPSEWRCRTCDREAIAKLRDQHKRLPGRYGSEEDNMGNTDHGDSTFVRAVEEPAYRAVCDHCEWRGPLREVYEDAVADSTSHAEERDAHAR